MKKIEIPDNLFKAHLVFEKMSQYPEYLREMREVFLDFIERKKLAKAEELMELARQRAEADGIDPDDEETIESYYHTLIDLYFAASLKSVSRADSYINLARKLAKNRELARLLHWENASSTEIYQRLKEFCEIPLGDKIIPEAEAIGVRVALINHFISNQLPYIGVAKHYITIRDVHQILSRTVWSPNRSGRIGGKAAGMLLAQKIVLPLFFKTKQEFVENIRVPDSYFLRSDIFDEFIQENHLEQYHSRKYESREKIEELYPKIQAHFARGKFSERTLKRFRRILEEIGEVPIIVRSSSFLEDNFGLAFSGKYDSIFLANQGDIETRLEQFVDGVKRVHMSTYHPNPISYRQDNNLLDFNEHMAVLVQKVVGRRYGDYFFPTAGGVIFSKNSFIWNPKIDPDAGLMRMVFGLGTRAVDRVGSDYPRMVALSHPTLRPEVTAQAIRKYSQRYVDLLNLKTGQLESHPLRKLLSEVRHPEAHMVISLVQGDHVAPPISKVAKFDPAQACITFDRLLKETDFGRLVREMVQTVSKGYGWPVDMEFAYDDGKLYLLQCRTLSVPNEPDRVDIPENIPKDKIIFTSNTVVRNRIIEDIEYIAYVDPPAYNRLADYEAKRRVGRVINRVNNALKDKRYVLLGPGRWGSNDINLGVQVGYHDINHTKVLGEVAFATDGITPEVSYGTHFFNDLIEADIVPLALYPDEEGIIFNRAFLYHGPSVLEYLSPEDADLGGVVRVIHVPSAAGGLYLQIYLDGAANKGVGFLASKRNA